MCLPTSQSHVFVHNMLGHRVCPCCPVQLCEVVGCLSSQIHGVQGVAHTADLRCNTSLIIKSGRQSKRNHVAYCCCWSGGIGAFAGERQDDVVVMDGVVEQAEVMESAGKVKASLLGLYVVKYQRTDVRDKISDKNHTSEMSEQLTEIRFQHADTQPAQVQHKRTLVPPRRWK